MDSERLNDDFRRNGYLLVRNALPAELVMHCRSIIMQRLQSTGFLSDSLHIPFPIQSQHSSLYPIKTTTNPQLMDMQDWISGNGVLMQLLEHPTLFELVRRIQDAESVATLPFKWLRAVGTGLYTGLHCDRVYLGRIDSNLLTIWIPIGRVDCQHGSMIVAAKSHNSKLWESIRSTYGKSVVGSDGTNSGWLCLDPNDAIPHSINWVSADFNPGDVCVIGLDTMHLTATNLRHEWRLSCDTRWKSLK